MLTISCFQIDVRIRPPPINLSIGSQKLYAALALVPSHTKTSILTS